MCLIPAKGGTIADTTNLLAGDGSGNAIDSIISPGSVGIAGVGVSDTDLLSSGVNVPAVVRSFLNNTIVPVNGIGNAIQFGFYNSYSFAGIYFSFGAPVSGIDLVDANISICIVLDAASLATTFYQTNNRGNTWTLLS